MMKQHSQKNHLFFSLLLTVSLSLTGCGTGTGESAGEESGARELHTQTIDWSTYRLAEPQKVQGNSQWYLTEYHDDWGTPPEADYNRGYSMDAVAMDGDIYSWLRYSSGNVADGDYQEWNYMDYFDVRTGQHFHVELEPAGWSLPDNTYIHDMCMADDRLAVFLFRSIGESGSPLSCCSLVFYHMEEGVQKTLDLLPALAEAGITEDSGEAWDPTRKSILCDSNGCCYLIWENRLIVVDDTGELLCHIEQNMDTTLAYLCMAPEGFPIFVSSNRSERTNTYWVYDHAAGEMQSLGETKYMALKYSCMDASGNLYYFSDDKIIKWNTTTGERENIFDCTANYICNNTTGSKTMSIREDGDLVIMDPMTDNRNIYVLSPVPPGEERILSLVSTNYDNQLEQAAATLFSVKNPGVKIEFSSIDSSTDISSEEYTTNLVNRIVAGDAPDMFIVSAQTMRTLYEKGALADLTGIIPDDVQEQVFDCVWNAGTIDGKLIGLTTSLYPAGILVSDEVWSRDTWRLEDILELADNAQSDTLKGLVPLSGVFPQATDVLNWLALRNIPPTLVDRKSGTCHFDSEVFRKLLEYCKNTPIPEPNPDIKDPSPAQAVLDGEYLAFACDLYDFSHFSYQMSLFPENYHWVGVPTDSECGNLVYTGDGFLVVSKDTENMDLIKEFLPTLYDEELRRYSDCILRRDVLREHVYDANEYNPKAHIDLGEGVSKQLECKPDGTSYVEDYIAFMDSCVLMPYEDDAIANIVMEEVPAYFSGDKDMDTVIGIIQNRVQLYLNETFE